MLRIGEFSRLSLVPVSGLRYYDEIGLLQPVEVDPLTGYRYYTAAQLSKLNRVNALKDAGLTLTEIVELTGDEPATDRLRAALERRSREMHLALAMEEDRLKRVDAWLQHLRTQERMETASYDVVIKRIAPQTAVCLRRVVPNYQAEGALWAELCGYLGSRKDVRYAGPPVTIFYDCEYKERDADVEVAVPVASCVTVCQPFILKTLPGYEKAASIVHKGPFETVNQAYQFLLGWLERNACRMAGPDRVVYLNRPDEVAPEDLLMELQIPVATS